MLRPPVIAILALALLVTAARGQESLPTVDVENRIFAAFRDGDYERAVALIEKALETSPNNVQLLYNGACAHCRRGDRDEAASWLYRAVKAGFVDFDQMRRDPDLAPMRDHEMFKAILAAVERVRADTAESALQRWRSTYGSEGYRFETDEEHRLAYATALDETSHREMRRMLERQADQMIATLFEAPPREHVLMAVPTLAHAEAVFGGDDSIGGLYQHAQRRLIARDIGGSLRHEFFHAYHYGHMERLGQQHPIWIQEGMASLYEDYELDAAGAITFLPNNRHNIVKRRARIGRLTSWKSLFTMDGEHFMRRAGHLYPQVRSIFEFIAERGKLTEWYRAYVLGFDADPSGAAATASVLDMTLDEAEDAWRGWVAARPAVDVTIDFGDAALGIESALRSSNDGVRVSGVIPGSAAARAGCRPGDVVVSVDGRPTRSLAELQQVIGSRRVGDRVRVRLRRDGGYLTLTMVLRPLVPIRR